jgi:hypothetical protein
MPPALHVVDTTQCRGGLDHVLPGTVVDRVGDEADVVHWGMVALGLFDQWPMPNIESINDKHGIQITKNIHL